MPLYASVLQTPGKIHLPADNTPIPSRPSGMIGQQPPALLLSGQMRGCQITRNQSTDDPFRKARDS